MKKGRNKSKTEDNRRKKAVKCQLKVLLPLMHGFKKKKRFVVGQHVWATYHYGLLPFICLYVRCFFLHKYCCQACTSTQTPPICHANSCFPSVVSCRHWHISSFCASKKTENIQNSSELTVVMCTISSDAAWVVGCPYFIFIENVWRTTWGGWNSHTINCAKTDPPSLPHARYQ